MPDQEITFQNGSEQTSLKQFVEKAYLDYSMYVILDRALPHIADGFKPVQRRIVFAMSELGLNHSAKHKKAARTVGDVLGKYHPHGDSACYEAMVHMAQSFSFRYPLIDGQGNWGAPDDPKSFAAMRYTEAKLTSYAQCFLQEIDLGTVIWNDNFDGSMQEPELLPARLPNILLNGASGIAVGMATDIPPHNLGEISAACIHLLKNPKAHLSELFNYVQGPDFPSGGVLISSVNDIQQIYTSGRGTLKHRASFESDDSGNIVINELPHQVYSGKILEQIAEQMQQKKLPMIIDLRDESDGKNPIRLVLVIKPSKTDKAALMDHLFASTDLEKTIRINLNVIGLDGKPQVKNLAQMLQEWLSYRLSTVLRRLEFQLEKTKRRLHILNGLLVAFLNIDEVIAIIRKHDDAKIELQTRFGLSELQAEAILEIKLRQLAKLEEQKIRGELNELQQKQEHIQSILGSNTKLKNLIKQELEKDCTTHQDNRRTRLKESKESKAFGKIDLAGNDLVTVILSHHNWIRVAKGHDIDVSKLSYKSGDKFAKQTNGKNNQFVALLEASGRCYCVQAYLLPSARSQGEPISSRFKLPNAPKIIGMVCVEETINYILASNYGYGFICSGKDLITRNKAGKNLLSLPTGSDPLPPQAMLPNTSFVATVTNKGYLLIIAVDSLPTLAKGKGIKLLQIPPKAIKQGETLVAFTALSDKQYLCIYSGKRHLQLKPSEWQLFIGERAKRGRILPHGLRSPSSIKAIQK